VREARDFIAARTEGGTFGEEAKVQREFIPLETWGERDTEKREESKKDFIVSSGVVTFEDTEFLQTGSIIVEGTAKMIVRDSIVKMTPDGNERQAQIIVRQRGELIFENSTLKPIRNDPSRLIVRIKDEARFVFNDSQGVHMLAVHDSATVTMKNSTWAFYLPKFRAGGLEVQDAARVSIQDSTIGGLTLKFPKEATVLIQDFKPQLFEHFNLQEDFDTSNVPFNVVLANTWILGDFYEGNSERGLSIVAPTDIESLDISNSVLNRVIFESEDEKVTFRDLELAVPRTFSSRNINFTDSKVTAQWGFSMHGGMGEFIDSKGLWLSLFGDAIVTVSNSELNRLDFEKYEGTIEFDNVLWENGGTIRESEFIWSGSWTSQGFDERDLHNFLWDDSRVTREFIVDVAELGPEPSLVSAVKITVPQVSEELPYETYTDKEGRAFFSVIFNDENFREEFFIQVTKGGKKQKYPINFLTPTPIKLLLE